MRDGFEPEASQCTSQVSLPTQRRLSQAIEGLVELDDRAGATVPWWHLHVYGDIVIEVGIDERIDGVVLNELQVEPRCDGDEGPKASAGKGCCVGAFSSYC